MELPVRRKSCLLRLRENCPFRKLRKQTYDVSSATPPPIGSCWNNIGPTNHQAMNTVYSEPLPPVSRCKSVSSPDRPEAVDVHMEEDPPAAENPHGPQNPENPENRAEDCMDLDDDVDPETGERAQS